MANNMLFPSVFFLTTAFVLKLSGGKRMHELMLRKVTKVTAVTTNDFVQVRIRFVLQLEKVGTLVGAKRERESMTLHLLLGHLILLLFLLRSFYDQFGLAFSFAFNLLGVHYPVSLSGSDFILHLAETK